MISSGGAQFRLSYELSPITFCGGIAANLPGGVLPIVNVTQSADFVSGVLGGASIDPDAYFATFRVLPGGALSNFSVGTYPFANQSVAANAIIFEPLRISLLMICPAGVSGGYGAKLAVMQTLKSTIAQHAILGGTYTIATPSGFYPNSLLEGPLVDVTAGDTAQPQVMWRWDFIQPLVTLAQAQQAQNALMSKISSGAPIYGQPSYSGLASGVGAPTSLLGPSVLPSATGPSANGIAPDFALS